MQEYMSHAGDEAEIEYTESPSVAIEQKTTKESTKSIDPQAAKKAASWIVALGGKENISKIEACAQTRLRVELNNGSNIDENALKESGVAAITRIDDSVIHLLVGLDADDYANEIQTLLAH